MMINDINQIFLIFKNSFKDLEIVSILELKDKYIVSLDSKDPNKETLDSKYSISKKDGEIKGYSPILDPKEYKEAIKHYVYKK